VSVAKIDKLARMANQIGAAFGAMPEREATAGAANHLKLYWTPKMIREIVAFADSGGAGLNPIAARAVAALKKDGAGRVGEGLFSEAGDAPRATRPA
jgi:formate dehydrogenase subunit delta